MIIFAVLLGVVSSAVIPTDECEAQLYPCSAPETTLFAECGRAGTLCQWACCLVQCSAAAAGEYYLESFDSANSCARAVGAPSCGRNGSSCDAAWAAPALAIVGQRENHSIQLGFADLVAVEAVAVVQNARVGFVTSVEVLDFATNRWIVTNVTDATSAPSASKFAVAGGVVAQSVRVNVTSDGNATQIDAVLLIGRNDPPVGCLPTLELTPQSPQLDASVADHLCVNAACQWACRLNECSSFRFNDSTDTYGCRNVLGFDPDSTFWRQAASGGSEFIDVSFAQLVVPSHVVVIDNDVGNGVTGVDVWVNGSFLSVFDGTVVGTGLVGAEVYAFTRRVDAAVNRVRVRFSGYRLHNIEAIRLVGRLVVPTPRTGPTPARLPGVFKKTVLPLASTTTGRFAVLAQNNPPAVADDIVYVPAGLAFGNNGRFDVLSSNQMDRCNLTSLRCTNYTAAFTTAFPGVTFESPAAAALRVGDTRVFVLGGGRTSVNRIGLSKYYYRTDAQPRWAELNLGQPRREACLVAVAAAGAMFIGGGLTNQSNSFQYYGTIEKITFNDGDTVQPLAVTLAFPLDPPRAEPGCAVVGVNKRSVMFAGGRHYADPIQVASDVVEILNVDTQVLTRTFMSRKTVAVTIASLGAITILSGGTPTFGPPTFGAVDGQFDYAAHNTLGVERYDMETDAWQYVPMVLTPLIYDNLQPTRLPVTFGGRFLAVVAGQTTFAHDGAQDPLRFGQASHERPIDVFDTFTNAWYLNVMQHHAGRRFMVAAIGNKLAVVGGRDTSETTLFSHNKLSLFEWVPNAVAPHACAVSSSCDACLYTNNSLHVERCRWCYSALGGPGVCISDRLECSTTAFDKAARAPVDVCATAAPTPQPPPPSVPYRRFWRLRIDTEFATWVFADFRSLLAAYLGCPPAALAVPLPVEQGSVIAVVMHDEAATPNTLAYDERWSKITTAPALNVLNATRLSDTFIEITDAPTPAPTTPAETAPQNATTAPAPASAPATPTSAAAGSAPLSSEALGLYIAIGVIAGIALIVAIVFIVCVVLGQKAGSRKREAEIPLNATAGAPLMGARSERGLNTMSSARV